MWLLLLTSILIRGVMGNAEIDISISAQSKYQDQQIWGSKDSSKNLVFNIPAVWHVKVTGTMQPPPLYKAENLFKPLNPDSTMIPTSTVTVLFSMPLEKKILLKQLYGKRSSLIDHLDDERIMFRKLRPDINRPIRIVFNSLDEERKKARVYQAIYLRGNGNNHRIASILNGARNFLDGHVKRPAEPGTAGWKVPFNSWGGKRSFLMSE